MAISASEAGGQYQLHADRIGWRGDELFREFMRLKQKLEGRGCSIHSASGPALAQAPGVVTSPTEAALRDA
jgi:exonuclease VII large subunit